MADENQFPKFLRNTDFYLTATNPPLVQAEVIFGYLDNLLEFDDLGVSFGPDNLHSFPQWNSAWPQQPSTKPAQASLNPSLLHLLYLYLDAKTCFQLEIQLGALGPYSC